MRRLIGTFCLMALIAALPARAQSDHPSDRPTNPLSGEDPIGEVIERAHELMAPPPEPPPEPDWRLKATLYHAGARGVGSLDSLGCKVVPMRTVAIDKKLIPRRTVLFIKETVGLPMPDGTEHDGYWYASDVGGKIKGERIDLYTGNGRRSMKPLMRYNLKKLTVSRMGEFEGCPPEE